MKVIRGAPLLSISKNTTNVTRIWTHDGWCYIPQLQKRDRFFTTDASNVLEYQSESWDGAIPRPLHFEEIRYSLLSKKPLSWQEQGSWGSERYVATTVHTDSPSHPPPSQHL